MFQGQNIEIKETEALFQLSGGDGRKLLNLLELSVEALIDIEKSGITVEAVVEWLNANNVSILNVAGNSEEESPGIESYATGFLTEVFKLANGIK